MHFAELPPEVNSGRMYAGPGSGPMLAVAAVWDGLAAELSAAATSYRAVVLELTGGPWLGSAAVSMAEAAAKYAEWMEATAARAQQTADQARSAVMAYETAFAAIVPPPVITTNRALLASLVAANIFGQNTPAIMSTETQYAQMWAQDTATMYGYAASSATAATLSSFTAAPHNTNPGAAFSAATGTGGLSELLSALPNALQTLATGGSPQWPLDQLISSPAQSLETLTSELPLMPLSLFHDLTLPISGTISTAKAMLNAAIGAAAALKAPAAAVPEATSGSSVAGSPGSKLGGLSAAGPGGVERLASLRRAASVTALSVPPSWATPPAIRLAASTMSAAGLDGVSQGEAIGAGGPYDGMPPMCPMATMVNAPRRDQCRPRSAPHHQVIAMATEEPRRQEDAGARWMKPSTTTDHDGALSGPGELKQLRKAIADVTKERDLLESIAVKLIKEANERKPR